METIAAAPIVTKKRVDWRGILFAAVAGLLGVFFLLLVLLGNPWTGGVASRSDYTAGLHDWHEAETATLAALYGMTLLVAIWRPRTKVVLVQFFLLTMLLHILIVNVFAGYASDSLMYLVFIVLIIVLYPNPRALFRFDRQAPISKVLLSLSLAAGVLMMPSFLRALQDQLGGMGGEHLTLSHWIESFNLVITLIIGLVMTSLKGTGWKSLGAISGITFIILGVAGISFSASAGSWGMLGGIISIVFGLAFIGATLWEGRKSTLTV